MEGRSELKNLVLNKVIMKWAGCLSRSVQHTCVFCLKSGSGLSRYLLPGGPAGNGASSLSEAFGGYCVGRKLKCTWLVTTIWAFCPETHRQGRLAVHSSLQVQIKVWKTEAWGQHPQQPSTQADCVHRNVPVVPYFLPSPDFPAFLWASRYLFHKVSSAPVRVTCPISSG